MDEGIGGGDCEEFEGSTVVGASLFKEERRNCQVSDGEGGGLGGRKGEMGDRRNSDAGGRYICGGVGGR